MPGARTITTGGPESTRCSTPDALLDALTAAIASRVDAPLVTVSFAQSLDGCISAELGTRTPISNPHSLELTHRCRAAHDALMVGLNTVVVDDPLLTVRDVPGSSPIPVVVDSRLRMPLTSRLLSRPGPRPLIATTQHASGDRERELRAAGAEVLRVAEDDTGRVDVSALVDALYEDGLRSVMVEGGRQLITSVLLQRVASHVLVTVAPFFLGGVPAFAGTGALRPRVADAVHAHAGSDLVIYGVLSWSESESELTGSRR